MKEPLKLSSEAMNLTKSFIFAGAAIAFWTLGALISPYFFIPAIICNAFQVTFIWLFIVRITCN